VNAPKPNAALAYAVLDQIDAHPEQWDQATWDCGTSACFAGWAVRLSGGISDASNVVDGPAELIGMHVEYAAYRVLGIGFDGIDAGEWLFDPDNGREDLARMVEEIFGPRPAVTA
jgi:hypothetical protein